MSRLGGSEDDDVDLDLGPVGGVGDDARADLAGQVAEDLGIGRDRVIAADRLEMRPHDLGQEPWARILARSSARRRAPGAPTRGS